MNMSLETMLYDRLFAVCKTDPELRPASRPEFGDFQCNAAMKLAKAQGLKPRDVAQQLINDVDLDDIAEPLEIAGPGFINIRLKPAAVIAAAKELAADPTLGIAQAQQPQRVIIDYSAPNAAKQMHIGHLRSTIIGDCFSRVLAAQGHTIIAQNHIGDWGRQFGMMIEQALDENFDLATLTLDDAEEIYKRANAKLKIDEAFAQRARDRVVQLQAGDPDTVAAWTTIINQSKKSFNEIYQRLGVLLRDEDYAGESFYNAMLAGVADDLEARGLAHEDQGALAMFVEGSETPLIIRNSQGGFGYDATDMAAIRYRVQELDAARIIYVVGSEQTLHFRLIFAAAQRAGYLPEGVRAEHIPYGMILGADGKKFSTREGAAHLTDLLDQADALVSHDVALGAIKYADLSNTIIKDYSFDLERMTATTGNTGPYLQYAHARCTSVLRKSGDDAAHAITLLEAPEELALVRQLDGFGAVVADVAETLAPHKLCAYLFDLATAYSAFYEKCHILSAEGEVKASRLGLVTLTKAVLAKGLGLLGIPAPEVM
ncbi:MAG: arginine--tRNA ligase [Propionibacteriaceae bacterium]